VLEKVPRTGSGGRGDILNADLRPYRENAAAASDENGHSVDHGRRYKAAPGFRQGVKRAFGSDGAIAGDRQITPMTGMLTAAR